MKSKKLNQKGFTLTEVIIGIAITSVLLAILSSLTIYYARLFISSRNGVEKDYVVQAVEKYIHEKLRTAGDIIISDTSPGNNYSVIYSLDGQLYYDDELVFPSSFYYENTVDFSIEKYDDSISKVTLNATGDGFTETVISYISSLNLQLTSKVLSVEPDASGLKVYFLPAEDRITPAERLYNEFLDLCLNWKTDPRYPTFYFNNDIARETYHKYNNNTWPKLIVNGVTYYIQPHYTTNSKDLIIFANSNNSIVTKDWNTKFIYNPMTKQWFTGKSFYVTKSWAAIESDMQSKNWTLLVGYEEIW